MALEELRQLIIDVQKHLSELANVEVKAARSGMLRCLYQSFSTFVNRTGGGMVSFELADLKDFSVMGIGDAYNLQAAYLWKTTL